MDFNIITKYKVGDIVLIKPDLSPDVDYRMVGMNYTITFPPSEISKYRGKLAKIVDVTIDDISGIIYGYYKLDIDEQIHCWTDEMFIDLNGKFGMMEDGREFVIANQTVIYNPRHGCCSWSNLNDPIIISKIRRISKQAKSFLWLENDFYTELTEDGLFYNFTVTPEYTMDELVKIVGHEFKLVKK